MKEENDPLKLPPGSVLTFTWNDTHLGRQLRHNREHTQGQTKKSLALRQKQKEFIDDSLHDLWQFS
eukprot:CAMPEP_0194375904 /NCGR_PEP_ID=MMETSP0174-20130528/24460_1 /TAXON_ID=216777 /ORGANISM="Proboscia alata, Strain PI-D3" /LENGTH=65 /DNA_ID=CAMNT_0039156401 /DNA_START=37 /DNA_END=231 /DNA_ORIENTATION=+